MPIDLIAEKQGQFFDPTRMINHIFDPRKNFLKTIWQRRRPVLDSELMEREEIDSFIRRQILVLLAGEITIVEGLQPQQSLTPNKVLLSEGEIVVRGWDIIVEKNEGGFPSINQNFSVVVIDNTGPIPVETPFPLNGLGFSPNVSVDQPVGDSNTTIIHRGTFYDPLRRELSVELENTCSLGPITYRVQSLDGFYKETAIIAPQSRHTFVLKENLWNIVTLPVGPSVGAGNRCDHIYLLVGEREICPTVAYVKRNGHLSHPESIEAEIFEPKIGKETSRRTQIQFDLRSCVGEVPEPPTGFYVLPLYRVLRRPGDPFIKLEDISPLVPQIDLTKSGLFELFLDGSGITHNTILSVNDAGEVVPPAVTRVVGSTIHVRNNGPANVRNFAFGGETFQLKVGETRSVNFNKTSGAPAPGPCGPNGQPTNFFNLVDADTDEILANVSIVGWGGGGLSAGEIESIRCAIGSQYFDETGPLHPCDDNINPDPGTEQSLDIRIDSVVLDMFQMALCIAEAKNDSSILLSFLFMDRFSDLNTVDLPNSPGALAAWSPGEDAFVIA